MTEETLSVNPGVGNFPPDLAPPRDTRRWLALLVLLLAGFMDLLDTTIVNIALPDIGRTLHASSAALQWIVLGYTLAFGMLLVVGGRLGDLFGRRQVFALGVVGFTLASALCGLASSADVLVIARLLQGSAAALMVPQVLSIIQVSFSSSERAKALGAYGAVNGLAAVAGPLLGGWFTSADWHGLSWRPIFLINVPVGALTLLLTFLLIRETRAARVTRLDLPGMALLTLGLLALLGPLVQGRELGWPLWSILLPLASLLLLAAFVWWERRQERLGGDPLLPPSLFRQRAFTAGLLVNLVFAAGVASLFLVLAVTLQSGLGFTPWQASLVIVPFSLAVAVGSGLSVVLGRFGRLPLQLGTLLLAAGALGLLLVLNTFGADLNAWRLTLPLATCGLGMGLVIAPLLDVILSGVPGESAGAASGVLGAVGPLGQAVGVASLGTLFFGVLGTSLREPNFTHALAVTLWAQVAVFLVSFALVFLLPKSVNPVPLTEGAAP